MVKMYDRLLQSPTSSFFLYGMGSPDFFRRLNPITGGGILPDWLASHPGLADRIAATDRPATGESAFDAEQWAAVKAVCTNSGSAVDGGDAVESGARWQWQRGCRQ